MNISKTDWKLFCERVPAWQERYMERLLREYAALLTKPGNASDHFWELEKRINKDKKHPGVIMQLEKSSAVWDITYLIRMGVITEDDLGGFSGELVETVKALLSR